MRADLPSASTNESANPNGFRTSISIWILFIIYGSCHLMPLHLASAQTVIDPDPNIIPIYNAPLPNAPLDLTGLITPLTPPNITLFTPQNITLFPPPNFGIVQEMGGRTGSRAGMS
jgi:hypothetical protein